MTHVRGIVYRRSAIIPFDKATVSWDELCLCGRERHQISWMDDRTHTLVLVKELYTFNTGSSICRVGTFQVGCWTDMAAMFLQVEPRRLGRYTRQKARPVLTRHEIIQVEMEIAKCPMTADIICIYYYSLRVTTTWERCTSGKNLSAWVLVRN